MFVTLQKEGVAVTFETLEELNQFCRHVEDMWYSIQRSKMPPPYTYVVTNHTVTGKKATQFAEKVVKQRGGKAFRGI